MPGTGRNTIRAVEKLREMATKYPDLRLCQIIGNAVPSEEAKKRNNDFYYVEDDQLIQWLDEFDRKLHHIPR